jgi:hypothetical protein
MDRTRVTAAKDLPEEFQFGRVVLPLAAKGRHISTIGRGYNKMPKDKEECGIEEEPFVNLINY